MKLAVAALVVCALATPGEAEIRRTIAGSLQLDYLAVPTEQAPRQFTLDGATLELSLKMSVDFSEHASATVKACFACHGFEAASAFIGLRAADELAVKAGRLIPLLEDVNPGDTEEFHAVYIGQGGPLPARVRALLDFLAANVRM